MTNLTIKPSVAEDIPALSEMLNQIDLFPSEMLADMMSPFLSGKSEALWLTAHVGDLPVGLSFSTPEAMTDGTWNMLALGVRPDHQRHKVGSALVKATEDQLRQKGQRLLIVDTSGTEAFKRARDFYRSLGFDEEARIRDFWADSDDKVTFRKALT